jgi:hypothetical protein
MKQLTVQDTFKKIKHCTADKNDNSGSRCSASSTY